MASVIENPPASARYTGDMGLIPGSGRSPEKEMATHSSVLAGKFHGQGETRGLQSMGF